MPNKLIMTIGLPGSGKSTWAAGLAKANPGQYKIINKDDLRAMLDAGIWSPANEKQIVAAQEVLILYFLKKCSVIIADTNFNPQHEKRFRSLAATMGAEFVIQDFRGVPLADCIKRDAGRPHPIGAKIIRDMYYRYVFKPAQPPDHDPRLPNAILVDMDGTLAQMNGRSPFDWAKVGTDLCRETVRNAVIALAKATDSALVIVSGRDQGKCEGLTLTWLDQHSVPFTELFMRPADDIRRDSIVKRELFDKHIKGRYNVVAIFDDRPRVIEECWQAIGYTDRIFNVGTGEDF